MWKCKNKPFNDLTLAVGLLLAAGLVTVLPAAASDGSPVISGAEDRKSVDLTIYNRNLALVREVRNVELPRGQFSFEFRDVPSMINPVTLLVSASGKTGMEILEQNYEFDLISRDKILQKYVGKELAWIQEDGERVTGTLLGMSQGPVFKVDGEITFIVPGRLVLPELPENLRARPTLVWLAETGSAGKTELQTSYLTGGMSWHADYVLQLNEEGTEAGLQAWVTVDNRSGSSFEGANLLLVAGDINQAPPSPERYRAYAAQSFDMAKEASFQEETLYDYHLYTMTRKTTLLDNQIKQVSLYDSEGIRVAKRYRLQSGQHYFRGFGSMRDDLKVDVSYLFENTKENQLGMPLPAGVFRVYGQSSSGARQLLGEDRIDHTPKNEEVELTVGKAFDIVAERIRSNSEKVASNLYRHTYQITLRNHRDEPVTVEVLEHVGGYWKVIAETQEHRKLDASSLAFDVAVPANGETVLEYTVELKY